MAASKRKSWEEKYNVNRKPEVKVLDKKMADLHAGETMLIATPPVVDAYIRQIPEGTLVHIKTIRKDLALHYGADGACPVTTGIFVRIVAERAYEQLTGGTSMGEITPFWRVIPLNSPTAKKLSFGTDLLKKQQEREGILV